jgi:hypothetical protein
MKTPFPRRKFLKTSALATGASLTAPFWLSRARAMVSASLVEDPTLAGLATGPATADAWNRREPK